MAVASTMEKAVEGADLVLLCSHSGSVIQSLPLVIQNAGPDCLIMDVSSVKQGIVDAARRIPEAKNHFVPCHPMAGKEKSGIEASDPLIYKDKIVFITPLPGTPRKLIERAELFWKKVGSRTIILKADRHDHYVALTSHLPHLIASSLVTQFGTYSGKDPGYRNAVGSGFRDLTRIAAGHPAMWADILVLNKKPILKLLREYRKSLQTLERAAARASTGQWLRYFKRSKAIRENL